MPNLLIRDVDEESKRKLMVRAAQNGRSQQAEALAILKEALDDSPKSWVSLVRDGAASVGGIEFEAPARHVPRITGIGI